MGIVRFEVELDNLSNTYQNGSVLSGEVHLDLDAPKAVKGLKVTVLGEGKIEYPQSHGHGMTKIEELKEIYIDEDEHLLGSEAGTVIPEGENVYSFTFKLPTTIPPSYKDRFGAIEYKVKATIQRSWCLWNHRVSTDFNVVVPLDLNTDSKASEPVRQEVSKTFMGCSDPVDTTVSIPSRGYVPGQTIPVTVDIRNGARVDMKEVHFSLVRVNSYHGKGRTRRQEVLLVEHESPLQASSDLESRVEHCLKIPSAQPSYLRHSKLMDLEYILRVEIRIGGLHKNVEIKLPVIIGTVALTSGRIPSSIESS